MKNRERYLFQKNITQCLHKSSPNFDRRNCDRRKFCVFLWIFGRYARTITNVPLTYSCTHVQERRRSMSTGLRSPLSRPAVMNRELTTYIQWNTAGSTKHIIVFVRDTFIAWNSTQFIIQSSRLCQLFKHAPRNIDNTTRRWWRRSVIRQPEQYHDSTLMWTLRHQAARTTPWRLSLGRVQQ